MRTGILAFLILLALASVAIADETLPALTAGTNTYKHVTIFNVTPTDVYFTSDEGLANVKLKDLDPALQKHFNYNPTNAAVMEQKQKTANAEYHLEVLKRPAPAVSLDDETAPPPGGQIEPGTGKMIWAKPVLNQPAPPLFVEKWLTPEPVAHTPFILIDFWQTASPPCRAVIPLLNAMQHDFAGILTVISITRQSEAVVKQSNDVSISHYLAVDTQARMEKALQVTALPHIIVIDPKGIVRWEGYPFQEGNELTEPVMTNLFAQYSN